MIDSGASWRKSKNICAVSSDEQDPKKIRHNNPHILVQIQTASATLLTIIALIILTLRWALLPWSLVIAFHTPWKTAVLTGPFFVSETYNLLIESIPWFSCSTSFGNTLRASACSALCASCVCRSCWFSAAVRSRAACIAAIWACMVARASSIAARARG